MFGAVVLAAGLSFAVPAWAVDWNKVQGKEVVLLYPGQTSWEWNLTEADHSAAGKFKQGQNCAQCHRGEEKRQGELLVSGKKAEPSPIPGFPGYVVSTVKFAYDDANLYVRIDFKEPAAPDAKMDSQFATKVAMIFNDPAVPEGVRAGCWASCHEDSASMPAANGSDRGKYLLKTRAKMSRQGGGDVLKAPDELAKLTESGYSQEWWQAKLNSGAPAQVASGLVFDKREEVKPSPVKVEANQAGGQWSVIMSRPLSAPAPYHALLPGKIYTVGFGIHLGHSAKRFHHVSYEFTMALGEGQADFVAAKQ
ncbi:MAG TPA: ethylbenzene dehydrogenase-related protein [Candidatus Sulfotelmatobacter sp.]|jgi:cytochrome c-type protein NapC|nr:ethylbenzene dehydrogenase-related protein [Candidatus Sulfotelmatobacter sp.]